MVRGKTWFRCPCCGTKFEAPDIEDNATVFSMPMPCPKCGTKSPAIWPGDWFRSLIAKNFR